MIISASRRTDIPAYYSEWFINRMRAGYACVRNPMNARQISRVSLSKDVVDCIVFWSKNPEPMMKPLAALNDYAYYFQFTLNAYDRDIEPSLPPLAARIDTFRAFSDRIGADRMIWRYDPILLNAKYTMEDHLERFSRIAERLSGYTHKVTISFLDRYSKIEKGLKQFEIETPGEAEINAIADEVSKIAARNTILVETCAEAVDLARYGIAHGRCIDDRLIEKITGYRLKVDKDKNQRLHCGCVSSVDIGAYNTCANGCLYCYANENRMKVNENRRKHSPDSPLLIGDIDADDIVTEKARKSLKIFQQSMFSDDL